MLRCTAPSVPGNMWPCGRWEAAHSAPCLLACFSSVTVIVSCPVAASVSMVKVRSAAGTNSPSVALPLPLHVLQDDTYTGARMVRLCERTAFTTTLCNGSATTCPRRSRGGNLAAPDWLRKHSIYACACKVRMQGARILFVEQQPGSTVLNVSSGVGSSTCALDGCKGAVCATQHTETLYCADKRTCLSSISCERSDVSSMSISPASFDSDMLCVRTVPSSLLHVTPTSYRLQSMCVPCLTGQ